MSSQAALYKILYQNDTLYQLNETRHLAVLPDIKPKVIVPAAVENTIEQPAVAVPAAAADEPVKYEIVTPTIEQFPALTHKILILIDEPKQKEIPATELVFLDNILKAVKSSANAADIINFSLLPHTDAGNLLAEKRINHFITFGVPLIKLHLDLLLIPYTPKLVEGIWFLLTDPLAVIEADRDLKRKLWQALQKMFENV